MIPLQEAIERALRNATLYGTEKLSFTETLGRILAEDVISDIDIPPFLTNLPWMVMPIDCLKMKICH